MIAYFVGGSLNGQKKDLPPNLMYSSEFYARKVPHLDITTPIPQHSFIAVEEEVYHKHTFTTPSQKFVVFSVHEDPAVVMQIILERFVVAGNRTACGGKTCSL